MFRVSKAETQSLLSFFEYALCFCNNGIINLRKTHFLIYLDLQYKFSSVLFKLEAFYQWTFTVILSISHNTT